MASAAETQYQRQNALAMKVSEDNAAQRLGDGASTCAPSLESVSGEQGASGVQRPPRFAEAFRGRVIKDESPAVQGPCSGVLLVERGAGASATEARERHVILPGGMFARPRDVYIEALPSASSPPVTPHSSSCLAISLHDLLIRYEALDKHYTRLKAENIKFRDLLFEVYKTTPAVHPADHRGRALRDCFGLEPEPDVTVERRANGVVVRTTRAPEAQSRPNGPTGTVDAMLPLPAPPSSAPQTPPAALSPSKNPRRRPALNNFRPKRHFALPH